MSGWKTRHHGNYDNKYVMIYASHYEASTDINNPGKNLAVYAMKLTDPAKQVKAVRQALINNLSASVADIASANDPVEFSVSPNGKQLGLIYKSGLPKGWFDLTPTSMSMLSLNTDYTVLQNDLVYGQKNYTLRDVSEANYLVDFNKNNAGLYGTSDALTVQLTGVGVRDVTVDHGVYVNSSPYLPMDGGGQLLRGKNGLLYLASVTGRKLEAIDATAITDPVTKPASDVTVSSNTNARLSGFLPLQNHRVITEAEPEDVLFSREIGHKTYEISDHLGNITVTLSDERRLNEDGTLALAKVKSYANYYAFGMTMQNRTCVGETYRYGYNGKEKDPDGMGGGGSTYDYGFRIYNPAIARFLSVDPMAHEREWLSPYNFCSNDPINRVDPTGALDNPVYDTEGNLLGTDDQGLQGKAIIMDKDKFSQGMKHEDAMKNSLGYQGLKDDAAKANFSESYKSLPSRPDYDGKLTLDERISGIEKEVENRYLLMRQKLIYHQ